MQYCAKTFFAACMKEMGTHVLCGCAAGETMVIWKEKGRAFAAEAEGYRTIILGVDPGLATVGYGVIKSVQSKLTVIDYGTIITEPSMRMPDRLERIYAGIQQLIAQYSPDSVAFEELFFCRNVTTAFSVGQARGVMLLAAAQSGLPLYEYTPMQIKQAVVGYGHAEKKQVQYMVRLLLSLKEVPKPDDAADALAVAICRANTTGPLQEQFRIK